MLLTIEKLKRQKGKILIFTHENPDADGIGSMLALYRFLKKFGKDVECAMKDPYPRVLNFLKDIDEIDTLDSNRQYDLAILVDASGIFRVGTKVNAKEIIRIDHHLGGDIYSIYDIVDTSAPSTTFIITKLLMSWDENKIDKYIAEYLYTGLITDTGSFKHSNVDEKTFEIAKILVSKGVNPGYVSSMVFERNKFTTIKLLQKALSSLQIFENGKIAGIIIEREDLNELNALEEETEGFVNYARSIDGVEVAFMMIQKEDLKTWRVSIRGKGNIDVRNIACAFNGGGHKDASGCRIKGDKNEVLNSLVNQIKESLQNQLSTA